MGRSVADVVPPTLITPPRLRDPAIRVPTFLRTVPRWSCHPTRSASAASRPPRRRRIGILDLVTKGPCNSLYGRLMHANLASIMPQVLAVWCEQAGHECASSATPASRTSAELPRPGLLFISAFSQAAQLSYAISNLFRQRGAVTVLGGPHARCYPQDARKYFDYVLGFTDQAVLADVLAECAPHRPVGRVMAAAASPRSCPACGSAGSSSSRAGQGADDQVRPDDRQPRLPVHLQLLHRLDRRLPAARLRPDERGPRVSADQDGAADRRLARPELRRAVRRLHGGDRVGGASGPDRTSPRAACRCSPSLTSSASSQTASRRSCRASSPGTTWGTSRRPAAPGSRRCNRSPSTST